jgi:hypothetical protein
MMHRRECCIFFCRASETGVKTLFAPSFDEQNAASETGVKTLFAPSFDEHPKPG